MQPHIFRGFVVRCRAPESIQANRRISIGRPLPAIDETGSAPDNYYAPRPLAVNMQMFGWNEMFLNEVNNMRWATFVLLITLGLVGCAKDGMRSSTRPQAAPSPSTESATPAQVDNPAGGASAAETRARSADRSANSESTASWTAETSLTGCLNKGDTPGTYVLTNEKTGVKTYIFGSAELEKHASNHKVMLTGKADAGNLGFNVSKIQHVAPSCTVTN